MPTYNGQEINSIYDAIKLGPGAYDWYVDNYGYDTTPPVDTTPPPTVEPEPAPIPAPTPDVTPTPVAPSPTPVTPTPTPTTEYYYTANEIAAMLGGATLGEPTHTWQEVQDLAGIPETEQTVAPVSPTPVTQPSDTGLYYTADEYIYMMQGGTIAEPTHTWDEVQEAAGIPPEERTATPPAPGATVPTPPTDPIDEDTLPDENIPNDPVDEDDDSLTDPNDPLIDDDNTEVDGPDMVDDEDVDQTTAPPTGPSLTTSQYTELLKRLENAGAVIKSESTETAQEAIAKGPDYYDRWLKEQQPQYDLVKALDAGISADDLYDLFGEDNVLSAVGIRVQLEAQRRIEAAGGLEEAIKTGMPVGILEAAGYDKEAIEEYKEYIEDLEDLKNFKTEDGYDIDAAVKAGLQDQVERRFGEKTLKDAQQRIMGQNLIEAQGGIVAAIRKGIDIDVIASAGYDKAQLQQIKEQITKADIASQEKAEIERGQSEYTHGVETALAPYTDKEGRVDIARLVEDRLKSGASISQIQRSLEQYGFESEIVNQIVDNVPINESLYSDFMKSAEGGNHVRIIQKAIGPGGFLFEGGKNDIQKEITRWYEDNKGRVNPETFSQLSKAAQDTILESTLTLRQSDQSNPLQYFLPIWGSIKTVQENGLASGWTALSIIGDVAFVIPAAKAAITSLKGIGGLTKTANIASKISKLDPAKVADDFVSGLSKTGRYSDELLNAIRVDTINRIQYAQDLANIEKAQNKLVNTIKKSKPPKTAITKVEDITDVKALTKTGKAEVGLPEIRLTEIEPSNIKLAVNNLDKAKLQANNTAKNLVDSSKKLANEIRKASETTEFGPTPYRNIPRTKPLQLDQYASTTRASLQDLLNVGSPTKGIGWIPKDTVGRLLKSDKITAIIDHIKAHPSQFGLSAEDIVNLQDKVVGKTLKNATDQFVKTLKDNGLSVKVMSESDAHVVSGAVVVYDKNILRKIVNNPFNRDALAKAGVPVDDIDKMVDHLMKNIIDQGEFPDAYAIIGKMFDDWRFQPPALLNTSVSNVSDITRLKEIVMPGYNVSGKINPAIGFDDPEVARLVKGMDFDPVGYVERSYKTAASPEFTSVSSIEKEIDKLRNVLKNKGEYLSDSSNQTVIDQLHKLEGDRLKLLLEEAGTSSKNVRYFPPDETSKLTQKIAKLDKDISKLKTSGKSPDKLAKLQAERQALMNRYGEAIEFGTEEIYKAGKTSISTGSKESKNLTNALPERYKLLSIDTLTDDTARLKALKEVDRLALPEGVKSLYRDLLNATKADDIVRAADKLDDIVPELKAQLAYLKKYADDILETRRTAKVSEKLRGNYKLFDDISSVGKEIRRIEKTQLDNSTKGALLATLTITATQKLPFKEAEPLKQEIAKLMLADLFNRVPTEIVAPVGDFVNTTINTIVTAPVEVPSVPEATTIVETPEPITIPETTPEIITPPEESIIVGPDTTPSPTETPVEIVIPTPGPVTPPAPTPEPYPEPYPSPQPEPGPGPQDIPEPIIYPEPQPEPEAPPGPPKIPRVTTVVTEPEGSGKKKIRLPNLSLEAKKKLGIDDRGTVAHYQGRLNGLEVWYVYKYPYKSKADVTRYIGVTPPGIQAVEYGDDAAYRSIQLICGQPPKYLSVDLGIQDIIIRSPGVKGKTGSIRYVGDPKQKTKSNISVKGAKTLRTVRRNSVALSGVR